MIPSFGISLPRHFVIQYDDGNYSTYIDPFHGGRPITAEEIAEIEGKNINEPELVTAA